MRKTEFTDAELGFFQAMHTKLFGILTSDSHGGKKINQYLAVNGLFKQINFYFINRATSEDKEFFIANLFIDSVDHTTGNIIQPNPLATALSVNNFDATKAIFQNISHYENEFKNGDFNNFLRNQLLNNIFFGLFHPNNVDFLLRFLNEMTGEKEFNSYFQEYIRSKKIEGLPSNISQAIQDLDKSVREKIEKEEKEKRDQEETARKAKEDEENKKRAEEENKKLEKERLIQEEKEKKAREEAAQEAEKERLREEENRKRLEENKRLQLEAEALKKLQEETARKEKEEAERKAAAAEKKRQEEEEAKEKEKERKRLELEKKREEKAKEDAQRKLVYEIEKEKRRKEKSQAKSLSAKSESASAAMRTLDITKEVKSRMAVIKGDYEEFRTSFATILSDNLIHLYDGNGLRTNNDAPLHAISDFLNGKTVGDYYYDTPFENGANLIYRNFARFIENWIYYQEKNPEVADAETTGEQLTFESVKQNLNDFFYFIISAREIPLWLQERIIAMGGLQELKLYVANENLHRFFEEGATDGKFAKTEQPVTLQGLIDNGATVETITNFVNSQKNPESLQITSLLGLIPHPQSKEIIDFLEKFQLPSTEKKKKGKSITLLNETHQEILFEACNEAIMKGDFNFLERNLSLREKWIQSADVEEVLSKDVNDENVTDIFLIKYLTNFLLMLDSTSSSFKKSSLNKDKTVKMIGSQQVVANYLKASLLATNRSRNLKTVVQTVADVANLVERETALVITFKNVIEVNPNIFTELFETLKERGLLTVYLENSLLTKSTVDQGGPLLYRLLYHFAEVNDADNYEKVLEMVKKNFKDPRFANIHGEEIINIVLKSALSNAPLANGRSLRITLPRMIADKMPGYFVTFYKKYLRELPPEDQKLVFFYNEDPKREDDTTSVSFLTDAFNALKDDFDSLKMILDYLQDFLTAEDFYLALTLRRDERVERDDGGFAIEPDVSPIEFITEYLGRKGEEEKATYLENLFKTAEAKAVAERPYRTAVEKFATKFSVLTKKDSIIKFADFLHQKTKYPYSTLDAQFFKMPDLKEILWHFVSCNPDDAASLAELGKKPSYKKAKKDNLVSVEQKLAVELLFFAVQGFIVPLYLQEEIKKLDETGSREEGMKKIIAATINPYMKVVLGGEKIKDRPFLHFAEISPKKSLENLIFIGASPELMKQYFHPEHFTDKERKADQAAISKELSVIFNLLIYHPQSNVVLDLIEENKVTKDFRKIIANGSFEASDEFLEKNSAKVKEVLNAISATQTTFSLPNWLQHLEFSQEATLIPFYYHSVKLNGFVFAKSQGLFEHMKKAAELHPQEFVDYLEEVELKLKASREELKPTLKEGEKTPDHFLAMLMMDLKGEGLIDIVKQHCPQDLEKLKAIYARNLLPPFMTQLEEKFKPATATNAQGAAPVKESQQAEIDSANI